MADTMREILRDKFGKCAHNGQPEAAAAVSATKRLGGRP
jgi:hypothetical protein